MALTQVKTSGIADDAVTLAKQAGGTDGQIITYDASGNPSAVGPGTDGQVLTSTGAGSPPAFEALPAAVGGATGLDLNDSIALRLGTDNDLSFYHDGGVARLYNTTGSIVIRSDDYYFKNSAGDEDIAKFIENGAVELYHNNAKTLNTSTIGVQIKGGNTGSETQLQIHGNEGQRGVIALAADDGDDNADYWQFQARTDGNLNIQNYNGGSWANSLLLQGGAAAKLYHNGNEKLATTSTGISITGNLAVASGSGIDFSAHTGHSGTGGEVLTDFEYGTWTPTLYFLSNNGSITYHDQQGDYTKVGNRVFFSFNIRVNDLSSSAGNTLLWGLPYQVDHPTNGVNAPSGASLFPITGLNISGNMFCCQITSQPDIEFYRVTWGTGNIYNALQASQIDDGFHLKGQGHYCTNS